MHYLNFNTYNMSGHGNFHTICLKELSMLSPEHTLDRQSNEEVEEEIAIGAPAVVAATRRDQGGTATIALGYCAWHALFEWDVFRHP